MDGRTDTVSLRARVSKFSSSREAVLCAFLALVVFGIFWGSRTYPNIPWGMGGPPGFYPRFLAVILGLLTVLTVVEALRNPTPMSRPARDIAWRIVLAFGLFVAAAVLLRPLGFRLTAGLVSLGLMFLIAGRHEIGPRAIVIMVATAFGMALILGYIFENFAGRRLPVGYLLF